jgi:hypothetical protein
MPDPTPTGPLDYGQRERTGAAPALVVVSAGAAQGVELPLNRAERTVGRAVGSDLVLDDPTVSRHHAVFRRAGNAVLVEDAGSTAGVYVNERKLDGPALLHPGDYVRLGSTELRLQPVSTSRGGLQGTGTAGRPEAPRADGAPGARFTLDSQRADVIHNVGRDQYNEYALKFAPLRRRARMMIRLGVVLVFGGLALSMMGVVRYVSVFSEWTNLIFTSEPSPQEAGEVFARFISSAFPFFLAGMAVNVAGAACIVTGMLMRRRVKEATR